LNLILILAVLSGLVADDFELPPNAMFDSTTVSGTLIGFEIGNYVHPVILTESGKLESYCSTDPLLDYFLTLFIEEWVVLDIQEAGCFRTGTEEIVRVFLVVGARSGTLSYDHWRDSLITEGDPADLLEDYTSAPLEFQIELPIRGIK